MEPDAMSLQSSFTFQPQAVDDAVFVPSHDVLMAYAAGEITADEAGLHNYYGCQKVSCPQCGARLDACYQLEELLGFEDIE